MTSVALGHPRTWLARPLEWKLHWMLRLAVAAEFIGHGAFGIKTKEAWVAYYDVFGIPESAAYTLMPLTGCVDVAIGLLVLFLPMRAAIAHAAVWGLFTALLRPMAGESGWETVERAYNFGVPAALLLLHGIPTTLRGWFAPIRHVERPTPRTVQGLGTGLRCVIGAYLIGHGALGLFAGKPSFLAPVDPDLHAALGAFEIALGALVLCAPAAPVLLFVVGWKLGTESLHVVDGAYGAGWEVVERGGAYGAPLALIAVRRLGSSARRPTRRLALAGAALLLGLAGCGGSSEPAAERTPAASATPDGLSLVAIGDSVALAGSSCDGCTSFADLWGEAVAERMGKPVVVDNQAVPDTEAADVLEQVRDDETVRTALAGADLIVVQLGINDTPWNLKSDPCKAAPKYPVVRWRRITPGCTRRVAAGYEKTLDAILSELTALRAGKPTALRVTTVYNATIGNRVDPSWDSPEAVAPTRRANRLYARIQCRLAKRHGGGCVDVLRAFNGRDGSKPAKRFLAADYTHPGPEGHELIAKLLAASGTAPVD